MSDYPVGLKRVRVVNIPGGYIEWEYTSDNPIDPLDAEKLQINAGYHPAGYGMYDFRCVKSQNNKYISHWKCDNCCD